MKRKLENVLSLQYFIHRQRVINLFRSMLRLSSKIKTNEMKIETKIQIRNEFQKNKMVKDQLAIKSLLMEGDRQLKYLTSITTNIDSGKLVGKGWPWERR
jgi:hypothetical protein